MHPLDLFVAASVEPLPTGWVGIAYAVLPVVTFVLAAAAIISISRHTAALSTKQLVLWCGVALLFTIIGPLLWFSIGRRAAQARAEAPE